MMRVLVTGASGFAGRHLSQALADDGHRVRAAARNTGAIPATGGIETATLPDLAQPLNWAPLVTGMDAIVHLAGIAHSGPDIPNNVYAAVNRDATARLARAAASAGVKCLVFVSSIRAQSGPTAERPLTEADTPLPTDAYGRSKLEAEDSVRISGAAFTILRPVVMYGPGVKGNMASLVRIADTGLPLPVGGLKNLRSVLAADNFISAVRFVLESQSTRGATYTVADPAPVTFSEIISTLRRVLGRPQRLPNLPPDFLAFVFRILGRGALFERMGGTMIADAHKLRMAGWRPPLDTRQGLAAMVQAASPRKSGTASHKTR